MSAACTSWPAIGTTATAARRSKRLAGTAVALQRPFRAREPFSPALAAHSPGRARAGAGRAADERGRRDLDQDPQLDQGAPTHGQRARIQPPASAHSAPSERAFSPSERAFSPSERAFSPQRGRIQPPASAHLAPDRLCLNHLPLPARSRMRSRYRTRTRTGR